jgi:DNA-binding protein H-NS
MNKLQQLLDQQAALAKEIDATRREAKADAVGKVRALMTEYGLTAADLVVRTGPKVGATKGGKVAAKYKDNAGNAWSGRGLQPKWLKAALATGRSLQDFAV